MFSINGRSGSLSHADGLEFAFFLAGAALDALGGVDEMRFLAFALDGIDGAIAGAEGAADAELRVDVVGQQGFALPCRTLVVADVGDVFVIEVFQGREHGVRGGLPQSAERRVLDDVAQVAQVLQVLHGAFALGDAGEDFQEALVADAAGGAFPAGFLHDELQVEFGDRHHAVVLVHDNHAAGTHHGAGCQQVVKVNGGVEVLFGQAAAGRSAGLHGFEFLAVLDAAADFVDDLAEGGAHGHFNQADVVDFAGKGEHFRALGLLRADGSEPIRPFDEDGRHVGKGLDVIDVGRFAQVAGLGREGGLGGRLAALPFHGVDEGGLLAADERSCPVADFNVEIEAGAQDVVSQQPVFFRLFDGNAETLDGKGVFRPDVNQPPVCPDAVSANRHGFDDRVGVAFHDGTVHEGARVSFVRVADYVFLVILVAAGELPFQPRGETAAAPASEPGAFDFVDDFLRGHFREAFAQGGVAVASDVFLDVFRIDEAAVAQGDAQLLFVKFHVLGVADGGFLFRVFIKKALYFTPFDDVFVDNFFRVFRFDLYIEGVVRHDFDNRSLFAEPEAAGGNDLHVVVQVFFLQAFFQLVDDVLAGGSPASRTAADENVHFITHRIAFLLLINILMLLVFIVLTGNFAG